jgi:hypothetical protein
VAPLLCIDAQIADWPVSIRNECRAAVCRRICCTDAAADPFLSPVMSCHATSQS